jgi:hypothetical protein
MRAIFEASNPIKRIAVVVAALLSLAMGAASAWMIFIDLAEPSDIPFLGMTIGSRDIGFTALCIVAATIVTLIVRAKKAPHEAAGEAPAETVEAEAQGTAQTEPAKLAALLRVRAQRINQDLQSRYRQTDVKQFLQAFNELHAKHVGAIESGDLVAAHEQVSKIQDLSAELEDTEFWLRHNAERPEISFCMTADAFQRSPMVQWYLGTAAAGALEVRDPLHQLYGFIRPEDELRRRAEARAFDVRGFYQRVWGAPQPSMTGD